MADSKTKRSVATTASKFFGSSSSPSPSSSKPRIVPRPNLKKTLPINNTSTPSSNGSGSVDVSNFIPHKERPGRFSALLNRFRARYASLPFPVRRTVYMLRTFGPIVPIGIFFSEHVLQLMWVRGPSMTPYLNENYAQTQTESDVVLVNVWPWGSSWPWNRTRRLERGMVVTFRSPANPSNIAIKRVIALPGDRVTTREPCPRPSQIVPFNHVWLEGDADDPRKSLDSNTYGPVSISLITGNVMAVLYPRMRLLKWWEWEQQPAAQAQAQIGSEQEEGYRNLARDRVVKEAVRIEAPHFD